MTIAANLVGYSVPGTRYKGDWTIVERLVEPDGNKGYSRTYGYRALHSSGKVAFLKALDGDVIDEKEESLAVRVMIALMRHNFEAQISDYVRGNNMDYVTLAIDHGSTMLIYEGVREMVCYLMFEMADGDVRALILADQGWDPRRKFRLLHNVAVGVSQLHAANVSHNDINARNVLQFASAHKVADLGQATRDDVIAPHDHLAIVGDPRYAAPELLYLQDGHPGTRLVSNDQRKAGDYYLLGSLAHYLFAGRMITPATLEQLAAAHRPPFVSGGWQGPFSGILPYWRHAQTELLTDLGTIVAADQHSQGYAGPLVGAISELCEPDPKLRGHPSAVGRGARGSSLQYYISLFDRLATTVH